MSTDVLGTLSFAAVPDVGGSNTVLNSGGIPSLQGDITANRPAAGTIGRLFIDTSTNVMYYDNGSVWNTIGADTIYTGTTDQITVSSFVISMANNPVLPGTEGFVPPTGTTAQRPVTPTSGETRVNSTLGYVETYSGSSWQPQGRVLQVVSGTIAAQSATNSQTPFDATVPLVTEGTQIWSQSFTPISASSRVIVTYTLTHVHGTATRTQIMAVFSGSTNIGSAATTCATASSPYIGAHQVVFSPGSTATITISCRVGSSGNGTWYINSGATNTLGGSMATEYTITEVL